MTENIRSERDSIRDITVHSVIGPVSKEEIWETISSFMSDKPTRHTIWDFRGYGLEQLNGDDVFDLIQRAKSLKRPDGTTILIIPADVDFGMGRMFKAHGENERLSFRFEICKSIEEAYSILNVDPPS